MGWHYTDCEKGGHFWPLCWPRFILDRNCIHQLYILLLLLFNKRKLQQEIQPSRRHLVYRIGARAWSSSWRTHNIDHHTCIRHHYPPTNFTIEWERGGYRHLQVHHCRGRYSRFVERYPALSYTLRESCHHLWQFWKDQANCSQGVAVATYAWCQFPCRCSFKDAGYRHHLPLYHGQGASSMETFQGYEGQGRRLQGICGCAYPRAQDRWLLWLVQGKTRKCAFVVHVSSCWWIFVLGYEHTNHKGSFTTSSIIHDERHLYQLHCVGIRSYQGISKCQVSIKLDL